MSSESVNRNRHTLNTVQPAQTPQTTTPTYAAKVGLALKAIAPIVHSCLLFAKQSTNTDSVAFLTSTQKIVTWLDANYKLSYGNLLKPIQSELEEIVSTPDNFGTFMGAINSLIQSFNLPLGAVAESEITKSAHQHFLTASANASEMKTAVLLINGSLKKTVPETATKREKLQLALEKIETLTVLSSWGAKKCNFQMTLAGLSLVNVLIQLSKIYLQESAISSIDFFELIKSKAEMTLKTHSEILPSLFKETDFAKTLDDSDSEEICREIRHIINGNITFLKEQDNDALTSQLLEYQNTMQALLTVYGVDTTIFNENMDSLHGDCAFVSQERSNRETHNKAALNDHLSFISEQKKKLEFVFDDYKQKLSADKIEQYFSKDFENAFSALNEAEKQTLHYLNELKPQQYDVVPFTQMSLKEQIEWSQKVATSVGEGEKLKLTNLVQYACREGAL